MLRLIKNTIDAGNKAGIPVAMCGEMAGEKEYVQLLLGLGLKEFSVHPASLLEIKKIINLTNISELSDLTNTALNASSSAEVVKMLIDKFPELPQ